MSSRSFHVESLGCAKNQVDSELMIAALEAAGWTLAPDPEHAQVLIVNTCGFVSDAKRESIETSLQLKARYPERKVLMVGCLPQRYPAALGAEMTEIDGFLGNRDPAAIRRLVEELSAGGRPMPGRGGPGRPMPGRGAPEGVADGVAEPLVEEGVRPHSFERSHLLSYPGSAYVKVAEGCDNRCTYCAIPLIRGALRSRPRFEIVAEIRGLARRGIREVILIAQDLGSYGADLGRAELPELLKDVLNLEGDFWVRLLYIHPDHFPRGLLDLAEAHPRLLPYFDLPFQHASPGILSAMGRRADPRGNLDLLGEIRSRLPGAVIRSTFLVGFPGETPEDFLRLLSFQEQARFDWLGVFVYSREEDTPAYRRPGRVARRLAEQRKAEVESRQVPITERALDARLGSALPVLIEERIQGERLSLGRSYLQAPEVDGLVVVDESLEPGSIARVRLLRRNGVDLEGSVIPEAGEGAGHG